MQGVGYRAWAHRRASELGLVGYVRNLADGRVHVYAEGDASVIRDLVRELEQGPRLARVERAAVEWSPPTGQFSSFAIRATDDTR